MTEEHLAHQGGEVLERAGHAELHHLGRLLRHPGEERLDALLHGLDGVAVAGDDLVHPLVLAPVHTLLGAEGADLFHQLLVLHERLMGPDGLDEEALARREKDREVVEKDGHGAPAPVPVLRHGLVDLEAQIADGRGHVRVFLRGVAGASADSTAPWCVDEGCGGRLRHAKFRSLQARMSAPDEPFTLPAVHALHLAEVAQVARDARPKSASFRAPRARPRETWRVPGAHIEVPAFAAPRDAGAQDHRQRRDRHLSSASRCAPRRMATSVSRP